MPFDEVKTRIKRIRGAQSAKNIRRPFAHESSNYGLLASCPISGPGSFRIAQTNRVCFPFESFSSLQLPRNSSSSCVTFPIASNGYHTSSSRNSRSNGISKEDKLDSGGVPSEDFRVQKELTEGLRRHNTGLQQENISMAQNLRTMQRELEKVRNKMNNANEQVANYKAELNALKRQVASDKRAAAAAATAATKNLTNLRAKFAEQKNKHVVELSAYKARLQDTRDEIIERGKKTRALESQLETAIQVRQFSSSRLEASRIQNRWLRKHLSMLETPSATAAAASAAGITDNLNLAPPLQTCPICLVSDLDRT